VINMVVLVSNGRKCRSTCIHVCMYVCIYIYMCVCISMCIYKIIYIYRCLCISAHGYIYICRFIDKCIDMRSAEGSALWCGTRGVRSNQTAKTSRTKPGATE
jgi:hypothetical protein